MTSSQILELRSKIYDLLPPVAFGDSPEGHAAHSLRSGRATSLLRCCTQHLADASVAALKRLISNFRRTKRYNYVILSTERGIFMDKADNNYRLSTKRGVFMDRERK